MFGLQNHHSLVFLYIHFFYLFADLLSQSTTKSLGNQTVPREFILSYIFVVISAVQMLKIMEKIYKIGVKGFIEPLHLERRGS